MAGLRKIPRRTRFFIGCEGESEQGYAALLGILAQSDGLHVHLDAQIVPKAGDPLALARRAVALMAKGESDGKPTYAGRFLLMDTDLIGRDAAKDAEMVKIANANHLTLVRQTTCIEAVLLRHIEHRESLRPPTTADAMLQLRAEWPEYKKGTAGRDLAKKFSLADVRRAAAQPIQADLRGLLQAIGML